LIAAPCCAELSRALPRSHPLALFPTLAGVRARPRKIRSGRVCGEPSAGGCAANDVGTFVRARDRRAPGG
jgi:hypothetical protein